jgi:hypothetical protein
LKYIQERSKPEGAKSKSTARTTSTTVGEITPCTSTSISGNIPLCSLSTSELSLYKFAISQSEGIACLDEKHLSTFALLDWDGGTKTLKVTGKI